MMQSLRYGAVFDSFNHTRRLSAERRNTFTTEKDMRSRLSAGITRWTHWIPSFVITMNEGVCSCYPSNLFTSKKLKETRDVMQHIVNIWPASNASAERRGRDFLDCAVVKNSFARIL